MRGKKIVSVVLSAAMLSTLFVGSASAASSSKKSKISSISVGVTEDAEAAGVVYTAELNSVASYYDVEEFKFSTEYDNWKPGKTITCTVKLEAKDGYTFDKDMGKSKVSVSNMEVENVKITSSTVTIKANYIPKVRLATPENLYYDEDDNSDMIVKWDKVEFAKRYEVQYTWDEIIESTSDDGEDSVREKNEAVEVTKPEFDVNAYITNEVEDVRIKVRAIPKDNEKKYVKASDWVSLDGEVTPTSTNSVYGKFEKSSNNKVTFKDMSGSLASGWQSINDGWYYFDPQNANEAVMNKWACINNLWYHFDSTGKMQTGWLQDDGLWYYLSKSSETEGSMQTGWIQDGPSGDWYYLSTESVEGHPYGSLYQNCITPDNFLVDEKGIWNSAVAVDVT